MMAWTTASLEATICSMSKTSENPYFSKLTLQKCIKKIWIKLAEHLTQPMLE